MTHPFPRVFRAHQRANSPLWQALSFALIGGLATLTHLVVALAMNAQGGVTPLKANAAGYLTAVLISYLGNAHFTFRQRIINAEQFFRFLTVSAAGLALGQAITYLATSVLQAPFAVALGLVVTVVPVFSFGAARLWAFATANDFGGPIERKSSVEAMLRAAWAEGEGRNGLIVLAIFLVAILPVVAAPILPMIDYYSHVARFYVLAHVGSDPFLQQSYEARWSILPNIGLDVVGTLLMRLLPALAVAKTLVLAIFAIQYFGLIALSRQISGRLSPLTGLLAAPLLYSFILGWGFGNFLLGLGLVFWGAAWWLAQRRRPWVATPVACLIAVLIFLTHGVAFALYGVLLGSLELGLFIAAKRRSLRHLMTSMALLLTQAVIPAVLFLSSPTSKSPEGMTNADEAIRRLAHSGDLGDRVRELAFHRLATIVRVSESPSLALDIVTFALAAVILGVLLVRGRLRIPVLAWPALAVGAVLVALMPPALLGVGYVADRMPLYLACIFVACLVPALQASRLDRVCVVLLAALVVAKLGLIGVTWQSYRRDVADFQAVAGKIPRQSLVGFVNAANLSRLGAGPRCHMYGPLLVPMSGAATSIFAYASQQPVALRGRLAASTAALVERRSTHAAWNAQQRLETIERQRLFDYVLICGAGAQAKPSRTSRIISQRGRFTLLGPVDN